MPHLKPPIKTAVVGYGMGRHHAQQHSDIGGLQHVAICDLDESRLDAARKDFPDVKTYTDVARLARDEEVQLVVVATPHNAHLGVTIALLRAGKHVVVEKPMAITVRECNRMIHTARDAGVALSVYHNRRWDGDFMAIRDIIRQGYIGDVFHFEAHFGDFRRPGDAWRSRKQISGGAFYDWGAHFVDWTLQLVPGKIASVCGQFQKRVWDHVTNEDHCEAYIKFESGAAAHVQLSTIAAAGKPRFYILGTSGAIVDRAEGQFTVSARADDHIATFEVPYAEFTWAEYYKEMVKHLTEDGPNPVTAESGRRVIGVIEAAERSSRTGRQQNVPYEEGD